MRLERWVTDLADRQGGFVIRHQLLSEGLSPDAVRRRVRSGALIEHCKGVYRTRLHPRDEDLLRGALLALPTPVVSHQTAAKLHEFTGNWQNAAEVSVHSQTTHQFPGVIVHRNHDLQAKHVVNLDGLPTTSPARTIVDLAPFLGAKRLTKLIQDLIVREKVDVSDIGETLADVARRGKPGVKRLRAVLIELGNDAEYPASALEMLGLDIIRRAGLPIPETQYPIPWRPRERFDAAYPDHRIAIEWDSRRWHRSTDRFESDRQRDALAAAHAWVVLRFTWKQLELRPSEVVEAISATLTRT